jgi:methyl-accepting chemotaxis protein
MDTNLDTQMNNAIAAHARWKTRLKHAIETGTFDVDVRTAARDNACDFGRWLHEGIPASQKASPHYQTCVELHARFHTAAAEVLRLALAGKKDEAEHMLRDSSSPFTTASVGLTREMTFWKQDA